MANLIYALKSHYFLIVIGLRLASAIVFSKTDPCKLFQKGYTLDLKNYSDKCSGCTDAFKILAESSDGKLHGHFVVLNSNRKRQLGFSQLRTKFQDWLPLASSDPEAKSFGSTWLKSTLQHLFSCSFEQRQRAKKLLHVGVKWWDLHFNYF